jgi:hypothetical protein
MITLDERIRQRLIDYYLFGGKEIAFELGRLYMRLASLKCDEEKSVAACVEGFYWLKIAGYPHAINLVEPDVEKLQQKLKDTLDLALLRKQPSK